MKIRIVWVGGLYVLAFICNRWLWSSGSVWGDWIHWGGWIVSVGDLLYLLSFALLLSIPFRRSA